MSDLAVLFLHHVATLIPSCAKTQPVGLRGLTIIEFEHAAESLMVLDWA
jgi:hypothetical protein